MPRTRSTNPDPDTQEEPSGQHHEGTPDSIPDNDPSPNLAEAITLMTQELKRRDNAPSSSGANAKKPDTFDGSDPKKLSNFILLCNLYFRNNSAYSDDEAKVTFALSYLRGLALDYFEPALCDPDKTPDWLEDWSEFIQVLRTQFGPIDPTADAEDGLDNLKMRDNHRIIKYNVDFNRFAIQTGWDDSVLRHRYYSGLAERIKDVIGQVGKPSTLTELKTLAHSIDARHWERLREKSRSDKSNQSNNNNKSDKKPHNSSNNQPSQSNKPQQNKQQGSNDKSNKSSSSPAKSAISDGLTKEGKLTQQERQRRMDNNLCLYCGGVGHKADSCNKRNSSAAKAKGRAAQVDTPPTPAASPASGKV
jgi:Retrotransposon gag protein